MARAKALGRILELYRALENARRAEMAIAARDVLETEGLIGQQRSEAQRARIAERDAMEEGDELTGAISSARQQMVRTRITGLGLLLGERRQKSKASRQRYLDSLQWRERVESLVDAEREKLVLAQNHKEQAATDDRYLSQRRRSAAEAEDDVAFRMSRL